MYYCDKANFEGLLGLASELEKTPELGMLAEYCVLREKGLRSKALARLDDFLSGAALWEIGLARRNVLIILQANERTPAARQFMTHPLLMRLIHPILDQWIDDDPSAFEPLRWSGLLRSDSNALRCALSLSLGDIPLRRRLIEKALDVVYYATHHLSESMLLLSIEETRAAIATARQWITSAPDISSFADLSAETDQYEQMVDDWVAYRQSPVGKLDVFPQWCQARRHTYSWPAVFYYKD